MTEPTKTTISFDNLPAGTLGPDYFADWGVTITSGDGSSARVSESGSIHADPESEEEGGSTLSFEFDGKVILNGVTLAEITGSAQITIYDAAGRILFEQEFGADGGLDPSELLEIDLNVPGAVKVDVHFSGSGGIEDFSFTNAIAPDGIVNGTVAGDLIDDSYVDEDGDVIDGNDAIGVKGTTGDDDFVTAFDGNDTVYAGDGNDLVRGEHGDDLLYGEAGMDTLTGGLGNDTAFGGRGMDEIIMFRGDDCANGQDGNDWMWGGEGNDTMSGDRGDDMVFGEEGDDCVLGGEGNDTITGDAGDDTLKGGEGADMIDGGADRDIIVGATSGDMISGGEEGDDYDVLDLSHTAFTKIDYTSEDKESGIITFDDDSTAKFDGIERVKTEKEDCNICDEKKAPPCFTPGTLIATPQGEVPVEALRVGDRVITRDNGMQTIRWIGRRDVTLAEMVATDAWCPVLIRQGALGHGLPERDMIVSPQHRVLVVDDDALLYFEEREVLIAAKHLVGRRAIERMAPRAVSYIHVMFDAHQVILSDGAWTESFQPGDDSLAGLQDAQREELLSLFPDLREEAGRDGYVAARRALKRREAALLNH
ncbi:Hint domain-containing protein [Jannaschia seohaensis]|uniref:Hemolysin type calcium-binding protein n=1 Tax=Jannaschia seohaensis TaxID=475081 RepID=A0A2Y9AQ30_9RHOB|nr:Hint domain-containing protein [Jannaschia seohaensis]PWJ20377.1 hemolysin type calcium-binding protein [Jannaschia seohaensis]SSA44439.1 Hemolysin-type calcium-binding repeat-containing protein [Jannaschia seohaensis]